MKRLLSAAILCLAACSDERLYHYVYLEPNASEGLRYAADDLVKYLQTLQKGPVEMRDGRPKGCDFDSVYIVLQDESALAGQEAPTDDGYAWSREPCGGVDSGHIVKTWGNSMMGEQYVVYELLHQLGVRFYHPEEEHLPPQVERLDWTKLPQKRSVTPSFRERSISLHLTHPLELLDPIKLDREEDVPYVKRYIDWTIKNQNTSGAASGRTWSYAKARGYRPGAGINLVETQQGDRPLLNPDDPRSEEEIIAEAIDKAMCCKADPRDVPVEFGFNFNPSEFTEEDDIDTVRRMTFIANYLAEKYPGVRARTINHGTAGKPTKFYGVRFYDLMQFAPKNLSVAVHTLMFYDLFRPAPVYGNQNFHHLYEFIERESKKRLIEYFPENAWWLTFDLPVPLYLPVTMEARSYDIQQLKPLLARAGDDVGLYAHHTFGTGMEWGYWQQDWCVSRMTLDANIQYKDCVKDIAEHTSAPRLVEDSVNATINLQVEELIWNAEFVRWLVGTDEETEIAAAGGIVFHPLPPGFRNVLSWTPAQVEAYRMNDREHLLAWETKYATWAEALTKALATDDKIGQEIRDGIAITGLRGAHMRALMDATLAIWQARQDRNPAVLEEARAHYDEALAITAEARVVVDHREAMFRYPLEWSIKGNEKDQPDADKNLTIYSYRYLSRAHRLFYWTRHNDLVGALFSSNEAVSLAPRVALVGEQVVPAIENVGNSTVNVAWGDGASSGLSGHAYAAAGLYEVSLSAIGDLTLEKKDQAAAVTERGRVRVGALRVPDPPEASILSAVLPGLVIGVAQGLVVVGVDTDNDGNAEAGTIVRTDAGPVDYLLPLVNASSGKTIGQITLFGMEAFPIGAPLTDLEITAEISTDEIINALVAIGGFEPVGGRKFVADFLGYTEATLPARLPVRAEGPLTSVASAR